MHRFFQGIIYRVGRVKPNQVLPTRFKPQRKTHQSGENWVLLTFFQDFSVEAKFFQKNVKTNIQKNSKLISNWEYLVKQNLNCPLYEKLSSDFPDLVLQF